MKFSEWIESVKRKLRTHPMCWAHPAAETTDEHALGTLCLTGSRLLGRPDVAFLVLDIQQRVGASAIYWQALYQPLFERFAQSVQQCPVSQTNQQLLLQATLQQVSHMLSVCDDCIFPKHEEVEHLHQQKEAWTYALVSSMVLTYSLHSAYDRQIHLHNQQGQAIGRWCPISGDLYDDAMRYTLEWQVRTLPVQTPLLVSNWVGRWVPSVALRWLAEFDALYQHWWQYLLRDWKQTNPLLQYLQQEMKYKPIIYSQDKKSSNTQGRKTTC